MKTPRNIDQIRAKMRLNIVIYIQQLTASLFVKRDELVRKDLIVDKIINQSQRGPLSSMVAG